MIVGHGNNIYQFGDSRIEVDFSSNIAFNNHSAEIYEHLREGIEAIGDYPDPEAKSLTNLIAQDLSLPTDQILVTNGSAEAFYLLAHLLMRRKLIDTAITTPSFSEYEDSCTLYSHKVSYIALNELLTTDLTNFTSVWFGSPNNPDGYRITVDEIDQLATKYPTCYFVVDRAYNDLSQDKEYDKEPHENVIIINSFTKSYGIPGLRLGYLVAHPYIISELSNMRPPWSVNSLSLIAGEYILANRDRLQPSIVDLIEESQNLQDQIANIDGFSVLKSRCNFFLVELTNGKTASQLQEYLVKEHRLLIRNASNFHGLTPQHIRIATQNHTQNRKLIEALQKWR
ncbi:MAG: aminotransferase class I/II-fold pyridoxal phosphate-dependent enzyme [Rikenellaceae bacterium]